MGIKSLSEINIDLEAELRKTAMHDTEIAPDGFHAQKIDNLTRFTSMWPKTFPPMEPNTPIYWLVDLLTTMITEHQMEPLKGRLKDHVEDVVAKEVHAPDMKKQIEYYIEETVKSKIKEYFQRETEKEHVMKTVFADEIKDL